MNRYISLEDFIADGYLLDLNRQWAHRLGLSLDIGLTKEAIFIKGFVDFRHQPGGAWFGERMPSMPSEKAKVIADRRDAIAIRRIFRHGSVIEPVAGVEDLVAVQSLADPEDAHEALAAIAAECTVDAVEALEAASTVEGEEIPGDLREWLEKTIPGLVFRGASRAILGLFVSAGGRAWLDPEKARNEALSRSEAVKGTEPFRRIRQICGNILAREEELANLPPDEDGETSLAILYPDELQETKKLSKGVDGLEREWIEKTEGAEEHVKTALARLEELWGMAQPGMRFWRGDPKARADFEVARPAVIAAIERVRARRSDYQKLLAGECTAEEVEEPEKLLTQLQEEHAELMEKRGRIAEELELLDFDRRRQEAAIAALEEG